MGAPKELHWGLAHAVVSELNSKGGNSSRISAGNRTLLSGLSSAACGLLLSFPYSPRSRGS